MWEQSKAAKRRFHDGLFHSRYFVGKGIDIGGKPDPLSQYSGIFARMESVRTWDTEDGDAQVMQGVADNTFEFVHSSHCLEHLRDPRQALSQWIRIVKPGGFLIITVPDEDMYEQGKWPSNNPDHKWTFTIHKPQSWSPKSINVTDLVMEVSHLVDVERIVLLRDFFREHLVGTLDQTATPVAECAIEIILRKKEVPAPQALPTGGALRKGGFNAIKRCRHGWMLYNLNDTNIGSILDRYGEFSPGEVALFRKLLKPGDTVVESGANIGSHTLVLSDIVGNDGRIFAFEPQRIQFQTLCANIALNSITNTVCLNHANGDRNGEMRLPAYNPFARQSAGSQCLEGFAEGEAVRLSTIDSLCLGSCRLIKADVEGMEEKVLRGGFETIAKFHPILYVENDRKEKSESLIRFIRGLGYRIWWHTPYLVEEDNYFAAPVTIFGNTISLNMLCLPPSASAEDISLAAGLQECEDAKLS